MHRQPHPGPRCAGCAGSRPRPASTRGHWCLLLALAAHLGLQTGAALGGAEQLPHAHLALGGSTADQALALAEHTDGRSHHHPTTTSERPTAPLPAPGATVVSVPGDLAVLTVGQATHAAVIAAPAALVGPERSGTADTLPAPAATEPSPAVPLPPPRQIG